MKHLETFCFMNKDIL